jgi:predicted DNA-binding transcriptional regulator AlpA
MNDEERLVKAGELARRLGISEATVWRRLRARAWKRGVYRERCAGCRMVRFKLSEIMEQMQVEAASRGRL